MISYMDMTFCSYYEECEDGKKCHRALTPEIKEDAREWWKGPEAPIAMFSAIPDCYKVKGVKKRDT